MNAAVICLGALVIFAFGYLIYSKHLARQVLSLSAVEPAI